jgi:hypothetical protein
LGDQVDPTQTLFAEIGDVLAVIDHCVDLRAHALVEGATSAIEAAPNVQVFVARFVARIRSRV